MDAKTQIRIYKGVMQWKQGLIGENYSGLQYDPVTFRDVIPDVRDMCRPFKLVVYDDTKEFCFFTSCILVWFMTI